MRTVILEDDPHTADYIKECMEEDGIFKVVEILYRADAYALEKAKLANADLYLFDIQLDTTPDTDGIDFAGQIKSLFEPHGKAMLVYLTAKQEDILHEKAHQIELYPKPKRFVLKGGLLKPELLKLKRELIVERPAAFYVPGDGKPFKVLLRDLLFVRTSKIAKGRLEIVLKGGVNLYHDGTLKELVKPLDSKNTLQKDNADYICQQLININKGILVNKDYLSISKKDATHFEAILQNAEGKPFRDAEGQEYRFPVAVKSGPQLYEKCSKGF
jgi:DNA-binding LytR/AlgR family response regulator